METSLPTCPTRLDLLLAFCQFLELGVHDDCSLLQAANLNLVYHAASKLEIRLMRKSKQKTESKAQHAAAKTNQVY